MNTAEIRCPTCNGHHPQGAYAFAVLIERLVAEGYVLGARKKELVERARNMRAGRGFLTAAELAAPNEPYELEDFLE